MSSEDGDQCFIIHCCILCFIAMQCLLDFKYMRLHENIWTVVTMVNILCTGLCHSHPSMVDFSVFVHGNIFQGVRQT